MESKDHMKQIKIEVMNSISREFSDDIGSMEEQRQFVSQRLDEVLDNMGLQLEPGQRERFHYEILNELAGYGPIQPLLDDQGNSEVMVMGPKQVYVERQGKLFETNIVFDDDDHVMRVINRILSPLGLQVDWENPTADGRLPDGSRVNVVIPPVSIDGPCITIRKFLDTGFSIPELIEFKSITEHIAEFLEACVKTRLNILISGNTSSGKTTLLNVLSGFIPDDERIVTIEDAAELNLGQKYLVRLETRPGNAEGRGAVTTRQLVRNSLRMRPDRIIVGEVRGEETIDMLQAMNTGHDGSLCTLHSNSPRDAIARLETMVLMSGLDMPVVAIRKQISSAIDLIVHMARLEDGARKITRIAEVTRMEGDVVTLSDLFLFQQTGKDQDGNILGEIRSTGLRPSFNPRLEMAGFRLRPQIFGLGAQ
jgi:pilus assembly protein CpaF